MLMSRRSFVLCSEDHQHLPQFLKTQPLGLAFVVASCLLITEMGKYRLDAMPLRVLLLQAISSNPIYGQLLTLWETSLFYHSRRPCFDSCLCYGFLEFPLYTMVVLTIVASSNVHTVYFDGPITKPNYIRLLSCSLYH